MDETPIVVAGGGPEGTMLAMQLAGCVADGARVLAAARSAEDATVQVWEIVPTGGKP
ncbi:MAG TPA: hypothetical protein VFB51_11315 [Solirubrobacterales bacterium]|nr:hypothetical protein [Solirubrobacterales bacterium]